MINAQNEFRFEGDRLGNIGLTEIIILMTDYYKEIGNKTYYITTEDNLKIYMASDEFMTINYPDSNDNNQTYLYGLYDPLLVSLYINVDDINNDKANLTQQELYILIQNTFLHELNHHIMKDSGIFSQFFDTYYLNFTNYPLLGFDSRFYWLNRTDYYFNLNANTSDVPTILHNSMRFTDNVFNTAIYSISSRPEEIVVRNNALCWQQKANFTFYWEMMELSDYEYCNNYNYPVYYDNTLNSEIEKIIEAYIIEFDLETLEQTTYTLPTKGSNIGSFMTNLTPGLINILFSLSFVALLISLFVGLTIFINKFIK